MYDLTTMQLHHRVADIERMRGRSVRVDVQAVQCAGMRVVVARLLVLLAARIAPPQWEQRTAQG